jgi:virginiamycin A acetyltransferase
MDYPLKIEWRPEFEEFCEHNRIFLSHPLAIAGVYKIGQTVTIQARTIVSQYSTITPNAFFSIGSYSFSFSAFPAGTEVGRYCSIGSRVETMSWQHPVSRFTTSPITYLPRWARIAQKDFGKEWSVVPWNELGPPPLIGNDVWIGDASLLKRGIHIGDGAIIATRSVVTKDVPPYAIVAGSPATVKRLRFTELQINRFLHLKWWRFNYVDLPKENWSDIDKYLDALENNIERDAIRPWTPPLIDIADAFVSIANVGPRTPNLPSS